MSVSPAEQLDNFRVFVPAVERYIFETLADGFERGYVPVDEGEVSNYPVMALARRIAMDPSFISELVNTLNNRVGMCIEHDLMNDKWLVKFVQRK